MFANFFFCLCIKSATFDNVSSQKQTYIPGGKFLGRIDDFIMEITSTVAKATPIIKNADISAIYEIPVTIARV